MIEFITQNKTQVLAAVLALSELLALIPALKSNSIVQLIFNTLKKLKR